MIYFPTMNIRYICTYEVPPCEVHSIAAEYIKKQLVKHLKRVKEFVNPALLHCDQGNPLKEI